MLYVMFATPLSHRSSFGSAGSPHRRRWLLMSAGTTSVFFRYFFFFSSRRRHTRFLSDWSSDVCSSDLQWPVEATLAELGLALRVLVEIGSVGFQDLEHLAAELEGIVQLGGSHEAEVVGGRVVFRVASVRCPHEAAHGQIEPRRAELSLVVPVRRERDDLVRPIPGLQHVGDRPVDLGIAATAALVSGVAGVAQAGQDESVLDAVDALLVP